MSLLGQDADQGSVENVNKLVKRVLGTVLSEQRMEGQTPNWTSVLGSVAAVINSQCGRGKNSVTAFEAVFGQKLDHPLSCSKSEACCCWTLKDRMLVSNEPDFDSYCKENYIIDDDDVYNATEVIGEDGVNDDEDNDGYFSEDEVPQDEMLKKNCVAFFFDLPRGGLVWSFPPKSALRNCSRQFHASLSNFAVGKRWIWDPRRLLSESAHLMHIWSSL